jgi:hypothetical protein
VIVTILNRCFQIKPVHLLAAFVLVNLVIGIFIVSDYGLSTDEDHEFIRSDLARKMYLGELDDRPARVYRETGQIRFYGTAFSVLIRFVEPIFDPVLASQFVIAHYAYFVGSRRQSSASTCWPGCSFPNGPAWVPHCYLAPNRSYSVTDLSIRKTRSC